MLETITTVALRQVEGHKGLRGLSLRAIARDAGCSHVNLYHYIASLDALTWLVYERALILFKDACDTRIRERPAGESTLRAYAAGMLDFAVEHEGLYRILWFEKLKGDPPAETRSLIASISGAYASLGIAALSEFGCRSDLPSKAEIYFSFLHGRIAFLLNGRHFAPLSSEIESTLGLADRLAESFKD